MMLAAMSSNSFAIMKLGNAKLKMKMLPAGVPVALCGTAIQFCDGHSNRSFLLLRIADLVVDAVDVLDVSVSEIAAFPPGKHLAFQALHKFSVSSSHLQCFFCMKCSGAF